MRDRLAQGQQSSPGASKGVHILRPLTLPLAPPANDDRYTGAQRRRSAIQGEPRRERDWDMRITEQKGDVDLLSLLAHQMMNPVALIDSSAQKMMRRAEEMSPAEITQRAARIQAAAGRLAALVRAVMERMRLHAGHAVAEREVCSAARIVCEATRAVLDIEPSHRFDIIVEGEDAFIGDPLLLGQMLTILVCNAAKYSPAQETITIKIRLTPSLLTFAITDRGIGIPQDAIPHLFKPFYRAANAADHPGTGLGLNIAERIAHLHGGSIKVDSKEGQGSTFTVTLPQGR